MRIGTYLRKSTDEHQEESLNVQRDGAQKFFAAMQWSTENVVEFCDSGISRAEFLKRPGILALREAAIHGELDVIVTRDETRLGGDMTRTTLLMQDIIEAGVRLFYYSTGKELLLDTPEAELALAVSNFVSAKERIKVSERTREHLEWKARQGLIVGGRVFGYDNIEIVKKSENTKRRMEYRINEPEAEIVRRIFQLFVCNRSGVVATISRGHCGDQVRE
jgi:site-specific DNA recombinase